MKRLVLLTASLGLLALASGPAQAGEDWRAAFEVKAGHGKGAVEVAFVPKDGYYVNSAYPMVVTLTSKDVKLGKTELKKGDIQFEASKLDGKALEAKAKVEAKGKGEVKGTYKLSICTKSSCSPPLKGKFSAP